MRWAAALVLVTVAAAVGGLALRSATADAEAAQAPRTERTQMPPPPGKPAIAPVDPLDALLRTATVLAPRSYLNLTLFPVSASGVADFGSVLTMDEALMRGLLVIEEIGLGSVNQVLAINRCDRYVFLMASEMIGGAKQDRTIGEDVLLAPHAKAHIPVFCVEARRWTTSAPDAKFFNMSYNAPMAVRKTARLHRDQSRVWAQVSEEQERLAAPSATGAVRSVYESAEVQRSMEPYVSKLSDIPSVAPNVIGVVVANGREIVCADLFYRPDLFHRLWPKLLRSYAADAIGKHIGPGPVTIREARRFLGQVRRATRTRDHTPGTGYALRLHGAGVSGSALIHARSVVHLEAFPGIELLREPSESSPPMDLDFRRQRLEQNPR